MSPIEEQAGCDQGNAIGTFAAFGIASPTSEMSVQPSSAYVTLLLSLLRKPVILKVDVAAVFKKAWA